MIVPRGTRGEWRAEWESEFRHRHGALADARRLDWSSNMDLVRRALGAFPDATWIRRQFTTDSEFAQDVRHGLRVLWRAPGFSVTAITILSLGLAGTVSIATLLDTLLFRPLPYADAERVVTVWQRSAAGERDDVAPANFLDWRERSTSFEGLAAVVPYSYDYTGGANPEVFFGAQVTEGFFETLGTRPMVGRTFASAEHATGAKRVVIITHGLWQRRFNGDPGILNGPISLDGQPYTIVGILPPDFRPQLLPRPGELSVWTPKVIREYEKGIRDSAWWNVVGRLKPGVSIDQANTEMASVAAALGREYPTTNERVGVNVVSLRDYLAGEVATPLYVTLAAVFLVLLIGCANVANLLLARGLKRHREFAIRAALGAGRARLVRQMIGESLLLSVVAAAAGVAMAYWLISAIVALAPAGVLRLQDARLDGRMMTFAAMLTTLTALAFGVLPALQFSRPNRDVMRERQPSSGRSQARRVLVAGEIALAVVLLVGAGLLIRSFERLVSVDPGFSPENTVALQVFVHDRHGSPVQTRTFFRETLTRMSQLPGVDAAGAVSAMPFAMSNIDIRSTFDVVGRPARTAAARGVYVTIATPGFFKALAVPLREGRLLEAQDSEQAPVVAVISEALKRREWPNESPIGRRIRVDWQGDPMEAEVVGVVSQLRHDGLDSVARPEVFLALDQVPFGSMTYVIRGSLPAEDLIAAGRSAVWSVDPQQPFYEVRGVEQMVAASVVRERFSMTLLAAVAGVALLLCAIGIYAVVSFTTAQRTREIGVRMALGADRSSIRSMVLREGAVMVAAGLTVGVLAALATTRYLQTLLFEIRPTDPLTLVGVCVLLSGAALLACYVPAARATRVDPVVALRID
jgi:putative ABC transport system permease protein